MEVVGRVRHSALAKVPRVALVVSWEFMPLGAKELKDATGANLRLTRLNTEEWRI